MGQEANYRGNSENLPKISLWNLFGNGGNEMKKLELELDDKIYEMLEKDRENFKEESSIELTMEQEAIAVIYAYLKNREKMNYKW